MNILNDVYKNYIQICSDENETPATELEFYKCMCKGFLLTTHDLLEKNSQGVHTNIKIKDHMIYVSSKGDKSFGMFPVVNEDQRNQVNEYLESIKINKEGN